MSVQTASAAEMQLPPTPCPSLSAASLLSVSGRGGGDLPRKGQDPRYASAVGCTSHTQASLFAVLLVTLTLRYSGISLLE